MYLVGGDGMSVNELSLEMLGQMSEYGTPLQKAKLLSALGDSYSHFRYGDRAENLKSAISEYQAALRSLTAVEGRGERRQIQLHLANAYTELFSLSGEPHHADQAEQAHREVLENISRDENPDEWAEVNLNRAHLYTLLYKQSGEAKLAEQALEVYHQVLEVKTHQSAPLDWAFTHYNLANLQTELLTHGGEEALRSGAISNYHAALEVYTPEMFPYQFINTQIELGDLHLAQKIGDQAESTEKAIQAYESVRDEIARVADVIPEAHLYTRLGDAYEQRLHGDRIKNVFLALAYYKQSLADYREKGDDQASQDLEGKIERLQLEQQGFK
jgi:hypothetical protein